MRDGFFVFCYLCIDYFEGKGCLGEMDWIAACMHCDAVSRSSEWYILEVWNFRGFFSFNGGVFKS